MLSYIWFESGQTERKENFAGLSYKFWNFVYEVYHHLPTALKICDYIGSSALQLNPINFEILYMKSTVIYPPP
jgi:hypothetical protein